MAINNATSLRLAVKDWVARDELTDAQVDLFINAAELEILNGLYDQTGRAVMPPLRCHRMEVHNSNLALTGEYSSLPTGFCGVRTIKLNGNPDIPLTYATPEVFNNTYLSTDSTNSPTAYTIEGGQLRVGPNASATDTVDIVYYQTPDVLTVAGENWICTNYPMCYLYGALRHLGIYLGMDARLVLFQSGFVSQLSALHAKEKAIEFSGSAMIVRTLGVTVT